MGVSAAMWVGVVLAPTGVSREKPLEMPPELPPEVGGLPPPQPEAFRQMDDLLARRDPSLDLDVRARLAAAIVSEAEGANLDPLLVLAVIEVESSFDVAALSDAGAMGLMQLREPTLRSELRRHGLEGDPNDPVTNVRAGVRYLHRLLDAFPGEDVALMAYNAGPNRILGYLREGEIPDRFHVYPRRVKAALRRLRRQAGVPIEQVAALRQPVPSALASGRVAD